MDLNQLEKRIKVLESNLHEVVKVATATATIVNILITRTGLTNEDITAALEEAAIAGITEQYFQHERSGPTSGDPGVLDSGVPSGQDDRDVARSQEPSISRGTSVEIADGNQSFSNVDIKVTRAGSAEGSQTEGQE